MAILPRPWRTLVLCLALGVPSAVTRADSAPRPVLTKTADPKAVCVGIEVLAEETDGRNLPVPIQSSPDRYKINTPSVHGSDPRLAADIFRELMGPFQLFFADPGRIDFRTEVGNIDSPTRQDHFRHVFKKYSNDTSGLGYRNAMHDFATRTPAERRALLEEYVTSVLEYFKENRNDLPRMARRRLPKVTEQDTERAYRRIVTLLEDEHQRKLLVDALEPRFEPYLRAYVSSRPRTAAFCHTATAAALGITCAAFLGADFGFHAFGELLRYGVEAGGAIGAVAGHVGYHLTSFPVRRARIRNWFRPAHHGTTATVQDLNFDEAWDKWDEENAMLVQAARERAPKTGEEELEERVHWNNNRIINIQRILGEFGKEGKRRSPGGPYVDEVLASKTLLPPADLERAGTSLRRRREQVEAVEDALLKLQREILASRGHSDGLSAALVAVDAQDPRQIEPGALSEQAKELPLMQQLIVGEEQTVRKMLLNTQIIREILGNLETGIRILGNAQSVGGELRQRTVAELEAQLKAYAEVNDQFSYLNPEKRVASRQTKAGRRLIKKLDKLSEITDLDLLLNLATELNKMRSQRGSEMAGTYEQSRNAVMDRFLLVLRTSLKNNAKPSNLIEVQEALIALLKKAPDDLKPMYQQGIQLVSDRLDLLLPAGQRPASGIPAL